MTKQLCKSYTKSGPLSTLSSFISHERFLFHVYCVLTAFHTCEPTLFTCGNGRCVPYHYRCDHYNDCGDNSDEAGCLFRPCDDVTEFACNNGRCISREYVCNGINNCYDNGTSDERNCGTSKNAYSNLVNGCKCTAVCLRSLCLLKLLLTRTDRN